MALLEQILITLKEVRKHQIEEKKSESIACPFAKIPCPKNGREDLGVPWCPAWRAVGKHDISTGKEWYEEMCFFNAQEFYLEEMFGVQRRTEQGVGNTKKEMVEKLSNVDEGIRQVVVNQGDSLKTEMTTLFDGMVDSIRLIARGEDPEVLRELERNRLEKVKELEDKSIEG